MWYNTKTRVFPTIFVIVSFCLKLNKCTPYNNDGESDPMEFGFLPFSCSPETYYSGACSPATYRHPVYGSGEESTSAYVNKFTKYIFSQYQKP